MEILQRKVLISIRVEIQFTTDGVCECEFQFPDGERLMGAGDVLDHVIQFVSIGDILTA